MTAGPETAAPGLSVARSTKRFELTKEGWAGDPTGSGRSGCRAAVEAIIPISAARITPPARSTRWPFRTSSPIGATCLPFGASCVMRTPPAVRSVYSTMTTASAPGGIGAPSV